MAIAYVQSASGSVGSGTSFTIVPGVSVTAGNLLVIYGNGSASAPSVTDNLGNVYTEILSDNSMGLSRIWVAKNITGGSCTATITLAATGSGCGMLREYSGANLVSPIDGIRTFRTATTATPTSYSAATGYTNELVLAFGVRGGTSGTFNSGAGYSNFSTAAIAVTIEAEDKIATDARDSVQASFTNSVADIWFMTIITISAIYVIPHTPQPINNYQQAKVGDGMGTTDKLR